MRNAFLPVALVIVLIASACGDGATPASRSCPPGTTVEDAICLSSDPDARWIVDQIKADAAANDLRAVVFGIRRGSETLAVGAIGESADGVFATPEMHYRVGNISAGFLTTTVLQLVEEGKLQLDDRLSKWFPDLPDADLITIEMLASSTAGYLHFPNLQPFVREFYEDPFRTWRAEELIAFGTEDGTQFPPGTSWLFSDTNLVILGEIVQKVEGRLLGESIDERILRPLGLENTDSPRDSAMRPPVLHGFTDERGRYEDATFWNPTWNLHSGSMTSRLADVMRWARALGTGELLTRESFETMTAPSTVGLGPLTESLYYVFGIGVANTWIVTNPSLQGYREVLAYLPSQDLTIVLASTMRPEADMDTNHSARIFNKLAVRLAPEHVPNLPQ